jgi:hypothetical protein
MKSYGLLKALWGLPVVWYQPGTKHPVPQQDLILLRGARGQNMTATFPSAVRGRGQLLCAEAPSGAMVVRRDGCGLPRGRCPVVPSGAQCGAAASLNPVPRTGDRSREKGVESHQSRRWVCGPLHGTRMLALAVSTVLSRKPSGPQIVGPRIPDCKPLPPDRSSLYFGGTVSHGGLFAGFPKTVLLLGSSLGMET